MKISVIVPVYNVETYLPQCINSIVNQLFTHLEIILVNDGSTDGTGKICDDFAAKDPRITVIHQKNGGVSIARNVGSEAATGEYITFVDSDDWLEAEMYERMVMELKKNPHLDMIMCDTVLVSDDLKKKSSEFIRNGYYSKSEIIAELYPTLLVTEDFSKIPVVSACSCLVRRSILIKNKIRFDSSLKFCEDYLFMAEIMVQVQSFFYLKGDFSYNYRQYPESRSKLLQKDWWPTLLSLNTKLKDLLAASPEFDFGRQLKLQLIHSALFLSSAVLNNQLLTQKEKSAWLQKLFNDRELQAAFQNLPFCKQSPAFKIVLYLMKYRQSKLYFAYRKAIDRIKVK